MAAMGTATPLGVHAVRGARRAAVPPEVGVPVPARHLRCWGPRRQGRPSGGSGSFPSARLRRAVPGPTGRTAQRSAFPCLRATCAAGVHAERGGHPGGRGPSRRPPAAGGAGPHRENWPEVGVPVPARHLRCWGPRRQGGHPGGRGPSRPPACGGRCRPPPGELARGRRSRACAPPALLGSTPRGGHPGGRGPSRRPPAAGCAGPHRRSAFPCLRATCAAGVHADRRAIRGVGVLPVRPPTAGCAGPHRENWPEVGVPLPGRHLRCWGPRREGGHPGGRGPSHPPACGGLCRPEVGVPVPARHLRCWGPRREEGHPGGGVLLIRPPTAGCAGPHRENWPEVGVPLPARHPRSWGPRREGGHPGGRGPSRPPTCGGLCRPEVGVPVPARYLRCWGSTPRGGPSRGSGSVPSARLRRAVPPEVGVPVPASRDCAPSSTERTKTHGSEPLVRCPRDRGESVKGGLAPRSQKGNYKSELAEAHASARGSFDSGAQRRAVRERGPNFFPFGNRTGPAVCPRSRTARPEVAFPAH